MSTLMRKQVYIDAKQEKMLKRKAVELRVTESELIRDGISRVLSGTVIPHDMTAWDEEKKFMDALVGKGPVKGGRTWKREDVYDRKISG